MTKSLSALIAITCACAPYSRQSNGTCVPRAVSESADTIVYDTTQVSTKPEVVSGPPLRYADGPRKQGIQGRLVVAVVIDANGRADPKSIQVIQPLHPELDREAVSYMRAASFQPGCLEGKAVRVRVQIPVDFRIRRL